MTETLNALEVQHKLNETLAANIARMTELALANSDGYIRSTAKLLLDDMRRQYDEGCRRERELAGTMLNRYAMIPEPSSV